MKSELPIPYKEHYELAGLYGRLLIKNADLIEENQALHNLVWELRKGTKN